MVGLGIMGSRMCANLVKAGFDVHAYDVDAGAVARAKQAGGTAVTPLSGRAGLCLHPVAGMRGMLSVSA